MSNNYWNYRIMRKKHSTGEEEYFIHEVYYDEEDNVIGWTEEPTYVYSSMVDLDSSTPHEEMRKVIDMMQTALHKPILDFGTGEEV